MTNDSPSPDKGTTPRRRIKRDVSFIVKLSRTEKQTLDSSARDDGFKTSSEYVRNRIFGEGSDADARMSQRVDGGLFSETQAGELAVALMHLYRIFGESYEKTGASEKFIGDRRRVVEELGLEELLGAGQ